MGAWPLRRKSHAGRENGRATTSHLWDAWSRSCRTVRPLLTSRKFRASQAALWIVTKASPAQSICRVVKMDTSLFGTSRLRQVGDRAENARQSSSSFLAPRGPVCFSALRFPLQRKHRDATRSKHVKSYSKWHTRLAKLDFNLDLATGGGLRKFCFLLLHRDITFTVKDTAQTVSTESEHPHIAPRPGEHRNSVPL